MKSSGSHADGLFALTRRLCDHYEGDIHQVKADLYARGVDPQAARRAIHQARMEGFLARARMEPTPKQKWLNNARAGIQHLVDLKRAGHSPRFTELSIPSDGHLSAVELRTRRLNIDASFCGSHGAMCAELGA